MKISFGNFIKRNIINTMMLESEAKKILLNYLDQNKLEFEKEVRLGDCIIDFVINREGKFFGVEVKGSSSAQSSALGQILNYFGFLSHIYLAAPEDFVQKFQKEFESNAEVKSIVEKIGIFIISDQGVSELRKPQNETYYFVQPRQEKRGKTDSTQREPTLDEIDVAILNAATAKGAITVGELKIDAEKIFNKPKINTETARKRLDNLCKFGFLTKMNTHPQAYITNKEKTQTIKQESIWKKQ